MCRHPTIAPFSLQAEHIYKKHVCKKDKTYAKLKYKTGIQIRYIICIYKDIPRALMVIGFDTALLMIYRMAIQYYLAIYNKLIEEKMLLKNIHTMKNNHETKVSVL